MVRQLLPVSALLLGSALLLFAGGMNGLILPIRGTQEGFRAAALASGWGANWLTGWVAHDPVFCTEGLGLVEHERVAGFIHIATETSVPPDRPRPDLDAITSWVSE